MALTQSQSRKLIELWKTLRAAKEQAKNLISAISKHGHYYRDTNNPGFIQVDWWEERKDFWTALEKCIAAIDKQTEALSPTVAAANLDPDLAAQVKVERRQQARNADVINFPGKDS